jgi:hypothetical protein
VQTGIRIYTGSGLRGVIPYVQFVLLMLFALVCSGAIQTDEKELGPKSLWCVCVGAKFGWRKKKKNDERAPSKWSEKTIIPLLPSVSFLLSTKGRLTCEGKEKESTQSSRVQGKLLPMSWAPLSSEVAGTVNLSGKLGASGSSLVAKTRGSVGRTEQNRVV